jgi:hypothetical protein
LKSHLDPITTKPTIKGTYGRAWLYPVGPATPECVAAWIIEAPWAHPVWHSYLLNVIHLRPSERDPNPIIYLDGATHELCIEALDPEKPRQPSIDGGEVWALSPPNFAGQIICGSDVAAFARAENAVFMILERHLSPDTDYIYEWIRLFGDSMIKK